MSLSRKKIRAVLFDLDGTLLDTEALSDKAVIHALGDALPTSIYQELMHTDFRLPWELKKKILGLRANDWVPIVLQYAQEYWGVPMTPNTNYIQEVASRWESNLNDYCQDVEACKGAADLVQAFANAGLPMAIATSSRQAGVAKKRKRHEYIFKHMNVIVCGDDPAVHHGKPSPDIYFHAARLLGVDPEECLIFEDAMAGVQAGKATKAHVIAIPDPRMDSATFKAVADLVLADLTCFDMSMFDFKL